MYLNNRTQCDENTYRESAIDLWPSISWFAFYRVNVAHVPRLHHDLPSNRQQFHIPIHGYPFDTVRLRLPFDLFRCMDERNGFIVDDGRNRWKQTVRNLPSFSSSIFNALEMYSNARRWWCFCLASIGSPGPGPVDCGGIGNGITLGIAVRRSVVSSASLAFGLLTKHSLVFLSRFRNGWCKKCELTLKIYLKTIKNWYKMERKILNSKMIGNDTM